MPKPGGEEPGSSEEETSSSEEEPNSSEEEPNFGKGHGGFEKGPPPLHGKNGNGFQFRSDDNGNNANGKSSFVILSDRHCCYERICFVLKMS